MSHLLCHRNEIVDASIPRRFAPRMNRSAKTPLWEGFPHHQSGFEKRPKQSATSLSFPDKPPGAHPLSSQLESSHAIAFQASVDVHRRQVKGDSFNHHRHYWHPDLVDSLPVQTVDEEEEGNIAIHGSQSFAFHYDDQVDLCGTTCVENQLAGSIQFVAFSDSLTKHDPYHNPISSVSLPFYTPIQRSLTSMQNDLDHEMTTTATTAPNSPLTFPAPNLQNRLLRDPRNLTVRTASQTMCRISRRLAWKKAQMAHVKNMLSGDQIAARNDRVPGFR